MAYRPRAVDQELDARLAATGAVVIEGAKAVGKTATARHVAASGVLLDVDENAWRALAVDPRLVLDGATPRLVDEWRVEPAIWNHIRRAVDDRGQPGQFILTGSAVPADEITRHTGAGRLTRLRLRPMTLFETGHSTGDVSLASLLGGTPRGAGTRAWAEVFFEGASHGGKEYRNVSDHRCAGESRRWFCCLGDGVRAMSADAEAWQSSCSVNNVIPLGPSRGPAPLPT